MIKIAILDDYQNVFEQIIDTDNYKDRFEFEIFNKSFENEEAAALALEDFSVLFLMRERTSVNKSLINKLPNLKYIMTSGMRNKAIDIEYAKSKKIDANR